MARFDSSLALVLVVAAHAGAIGSVLWARAPQPMKITMPTVEGVLIPAPPAEQLKAPPAPEPPKLLPVEQPKPKPKPKPEPKPKPQPRPQPKLPPPPDGPPSERAVSAPESAPESPPVAESTLSRNDDELAAPVVPPRVDASQLNNPAPAYPTLSRRLREEGTVFLELMIEPDGLVSDIRVKTSSGFARLDAAALAAVSKWRYVPAKRGGVAISFRYVQPIEFSLNR
jgi:protein TonB